MLNFNTDEGYIDSISKNNAGLVIGDRTFNLKDSFSFKYNLSEEMFKFKVFHLFLLIELTIYHYV